MIDYERFKESVINKIIEFMPTEYADYEPRVISVKKVNRTLDCLNLIPKENKNWNVTPNIYIEYIYEEFKKHGDLDKSLEKMALMIDYAFKHLKPLPVPENISQLKHTVIVVLINKMKNIDLLNTVPHRDFLDLAIIYKCLIPSSNGELGTALVDLDFQKNLNMTEEELYDIAIHNTRKLLPIKIERLDQIIGEILEENDEPKSKLYVISNDIGIHGAVSMIYEEEIYNLAQNLDSDLYILPSSIHEVIAIPTGAEEVEWLEELVYSVNVEQVEVEECLSYNVYYYNRRSRKISIASKKYQTLN